MKQNHKLKKNKTYETPPSHFKQHAAKNIPHMHVTLNNNAGHAGQVSTKITYQAKNDT